VIVTDLGSRQHGLHQIGVAAGDLEEAEGRFENVVQGFSKDRPDLAVSEATAFDQLAIRLPLLPGTGPARRRPPLRRRAEIDEYERLPGRCLLSTKVQPKGKRSENPQFLSISFVRGKRGRPEG
jgi:hypothetical protein